MKKLILALTTVAFIGIGGSAVSAQAPPTYPPVLPGVSLPLPIECSEASLGIDRNGDGYNDKDAEGKPLKDANGNPFFCVDFYVEEAEQLPPATTTTTIPVTVPPQDLPRTGSGVSPILSIGALLLIGGGIVVVASRRRSDAAPST